MLVILFVQTKKAAAKMSYMWENCYHQACLNKKAGKVNHRKLQNWQWTFLKAQQLLHLLVSQGSILKDRLDEKGEFENSFWHRTLMRALLVVFVKLTRSIATLNSDLNAGEFHKSIILLLKYSMPSSKRKASMPRCLILLERKLKKQASNTYTQCSIGLWT